MTQGELTLNTPEKQGIKRKAPEEETKLVLREEPLQEMPAKKKEPEQETRLVRSVHRNKGGRQ